MTSATTTPPTALRSPAVAVDATPFWKPWEGTIKSFSGFQKLVEGLFSKWIAQGRVLAWRGAVDATWPLHSSLYRRVGCASNGKWSGEKTFASYEGELLTAVHRWGLHRGETGRLSLLEQLAVLQHHGAPTRLLDITFNAYVALWFAVEEKHDEQVGLNGKDGRLFVIDVTDRLINENDTRRRWAESYKRPWRRSPGSTDWQLHTFAWKPPPLDRRIFAQHGGFLLGGVPSSGSRQHPRQWPRGPSIAKYWSIDDVRSFLSMPLRVNKLGATAGGQPGQPVFTVRVAASAKAAIRKRLSELFGYSHSVLFPDFPGFAAFGAGHAIRSVK